MTKEELEAIWKYMSTAERLRTLRVNKLDFLVERMTEVLATRAAELGRLGLKVPKEGTEAYEFGLELLLSVDKQHDEYKHEVTKEFERPICFISAAKSTDWKEDEFDTKSIACFSEEQYLEISRKLEKDGYSFWRENRGEKYYELLFVQYCEELQGIYGEEM